MLEDTNSLDGAHNDMRWLFNSLFQLRFAFVFLKVEEGDYLDASRNHYTTRNEDS